MALTKEVAVDQITIDEQGFVYYREATTIMEDGVQLSKTFHRTSVYPGADTTGLPANVVAICNVSWTPEIVSAYNAKQAAKNTLLPE